MSASQRQLLNLGGHYPELETKLKQAVTLIQEVIDDVREDIGSDGQYDNAADDGALCSMLGHAIGIIKSELPPFEEGKI
jgi:hypothetical protein